MSFSAFKREYLAAVLPTELSSRFKSKHDLYLYMTEQCKNDYI
jgi:hypothetical protein